MKIRVLFLCTGNSCRSQMAEGLARHFKSDLIEPFSAGIEAHGLNPYAVKVMSEIGIDISRQHSKNVTSMIDSCFDYVITVCGNAHETCPVFENKTKTIHVGFEDPPYLAKSARNEEEILNCYRKVRDEIKDFIEKMPANLQS